MTHCAEFGYVVQGWAGKFNQGEFYEAHEIAEERWHVAQEPEKTFLKGLIHAAVALCHHQRGNSHGARVKYLSAKAYLFGYLPNYGGLELAGLIHELDLYFAPLLASPPGDPLPIPDAPLPQVRFLNDEHPNEER